jgi:hypothetical protein
MGLFSAIKKLFQTKEVVKMSKNRAVPDLGNGMCSPGRGFQKPENIPLPAVALAPTLTATSNEPVIALALNPAPVPTCPACGQPLPPTVANAPVVAPAAIVPSGPVDYSDNTRPIDWEEEARTDLPMRTQKRIAYLLKFETAEQTQARILSDQMRYRYQRQREGNL